MPTGIRHILNNYLAKNDIDVILLDRVINKLVKVSDGASLTQVRRQFWNSNMLCRTNAGVS